MTNLLDIDKLLDTSKIHVTENSMSETWKKILSLFWWYISPYQFVNLYFKLFSDDTKIRFEKIKTNVFSLWIKFIVELVQDNLSDSSNDVRLLSEKFFVIYCFYKLIDKDDDKLAKDLLEFLLTRFKVCKDDLLFLLYISLESWNLDLGWILTIFYLSRYNIDYQFISVLFESWLYNEIFKTIIEWPESSLQLEDIVNELLCMVDSFEKWEVNIDKKIMWKIFEYTWIMFYEVIWWTIDVNDVEYNEYASQWLRYFTLGYEYWNNNCLSTIIDLHMILDNEESAYKYAIDWYLNGVDWSLQNIVYVLISQWDFDKALKFLNSFDGYSKIDSDDIFFYYFDMLKDKYESIDEYEKANECFQKALDYIKKFISNKWYRYSPELLSYIEHLMWFKLEEECELFYRADKLREWITKYWILEYFSEYFSCIKNIIDQLELDNSNLIEVISFIENIINNYSNDTYEILSIDEPFDLTWSFGLLKNEFEIYWNLNSLVAKNLLRDLLVFFILWELRELSNYIDIHDLDNLTDVDKLIYYVTSKLSWEWSHSSLQNYIMQWWDLSDIDFTYEEISLFWEWCEELFLRDFINENIRFCVQSINIDKLIDKLSKIEQWLSTVNEINELEVWYACHYCVYNWKFELLEKFYKEWIDFSDLSKYDVYNLRVITIISLIFWHNSIWLYLWWSFIDEESKEIKDVYLLLKCYFWLYLEWNADQYVIDWIHMLFELFQDKLSEIEGGELSNEELWLIYHWLFIISESILWDKNWAYEYLVQWMKLWNYDCIQAYGVYYLLEWDINEWLKHLKQSLKLSRNNNLYIKVIYSLEDIKSIIEIIDLWILLKIKNAELDWLDRIRLLREKLDEEFKSLILEYYKNAVKKWNIKFDKNKDFKFLYSDVLIELTESRRQWKENEIFVLLYELVYLYWDFDSLMDFIELINHYFEKLKSRWNFSDLLNIFYDLIINDHTFWDEKNEDDLNEVITIQTVQAYLYHLIQWIEKIIVYDWESAISAIEYYNWIEYRTKQTAFNNWKIH